MQIGFLNLCKACASIICKFGEDCEKENFSFYVLTLCNINSNLINSKIIKLIMCNHHNITNLGVSHTNNALSASATNDND